MLTLTVVLLTGMHPQVTLPTPTSSTTPQVKMVVQYSLEQAVTTATFSIPNL
jgi:hypothetical protein